MGVLISGNLTTKPSTLSPRISIMPLKIKPISEKSARKLSSFALVPSASCSFNLFSSMLLAVIRTNLIELPAGNLLSISFFWKAGRVTLK